MSLSCCRYLNGCWLPLNLQVSDFGLSRPINLGETHISLGNALGTIAYTAPETFATNMAKKPSDVYAFGVMSESYLKRA